MNEVIEPLARLTAHGTAEIEVSHEKWQLYRASRIGVDAIFMRPIVIQHHWRGHTGSRVARRWSA